jgi:hypothetical protein
MMQNAHNFIHDYKHITPCINHNLNACKSFCSNESVTRLHWEHHTYLPPISFIRYEENKMELILLRKQ